MFADATFWPAELPLLPYSRFTVYPEVFHHAVKGLVVQTSKRLRTSLMGGIAALGATITDIRPAVKHH